VKPILKPTCEELVEALRPMIQGTSFISGEQVDRARALLARHDSPDTNLWDFRARHDSSDTDTNLWDFRARPRNPGYGVGGLTNYSVLEMRLCEPGRVFLKPNQLYFFTVDESCPFCLRARANAAGEE
jgi:hypothetical protein